jgi:phage shock protein A
MGIFSRLSDIINSNLNSMLDKAEDPEKIARLIIQEMEDTLVEVRTGAARAMADRKEIEREIVHFEARRDEWANKAELALGKDREDLARGALMAKQKAEGELAVRQHALNVAEEAIAQRQDDLVKLQAKLEEAKSKHRALMMRREAAETRIRVRSQVYDDKVDNALARYAQVERKVDEMEAYAETYADRGGKSLEAQFAELEASDAVEAELEVLKAKVAKPAKAITKTTEG